jgi:transcription factor WhiB
MTLCCEDPELWFTDTETAVARAKAICNRCPKLASCRAHALDTRERHGRGLPGCSSASRSASVRPTGPMRSVRDRRSTKCAIACE